MVTYEVRAYPNVDNDVYENYAIISLAMSCNDTEYEIIIDFFSRSEWFPTESLVVGVGEDMRVMLALFGLTATRDVVVRNYPVRLSLKAVDAIKVAGDGNEIDGICGTRMFLDPNTHVITHFAGVVDL